MADSFSREIQFQDAIAILLVGMKRSLWLLKQLNDISSGNLL
ncbi:hypothetical protein [Hyella patelloides]|nr:hypothetical protein [Hyella patelloides]